MWVFSSSSTLCNDLINNSEEVPILTNFSEFMFTEKQQIRSKTEKKRVRICLTSSEILFFLGRDDIISDITDPRKKWSRPCLHVKLFFTKRKHKHVPPLSYFSFFLWYFLFLYLITSDSWVIIQPGLWPNYRLLLWQPQSAFKNLTKHSWQIFDRSSSAFEGSSFSLITLERYKTSEEDIWGQT